MAKKIKFPLKLANGTEARTLDELKEHFDINSVVGYFSDGRLLNWLKARYYDDEADKVSALAKDDKDVAKKLCEIFGVESEEDVDPEEIARRQERLNRLKQYTDDRDILERVDQVAFDQEDLGDLLDEDMTLIYLCNNRFTIPLRLTDKTYVGIGKTVAVIRSNKPVDFDALNIEFKRIRFDDDYQKILDAPPPSINTNSSFTKSLERAEHFKNQFVKLKKLFSKSDPDKARIKDLLHELSKMVESKRYPKEMRLIGDCYKEIGEQQEAEYFYKTAENFSSGQTQSSAFKKNSASTPAHSLANIPLKPGEHFIRSPMTGYIVMAEKIKGKGVIAGIAVGNILLAGQNLDGYLAKYKAGTKAAEKKKAADALVAVAENLKHSINSFNEQGLKEQAGILEAHRMMVEDPAMSGAIDEQVDVSGSAPKAVLDAYEATAQVFEAMEDEYFRGRAVDMRDVGKRIAKYLLGIKDPEIVGKVIVAGKDIEPSVIAGLPTDKIAGVILGVGSTTAHAVIIAKTRAIPTVVGVGDGIAQIANGDPVILDGETGEVFIRPSNKERAAFDEKIKKQEELKAHYAQLKDKPSTN